LEVATVGSLDYKIYRSGPADDLYKWLKDNKYKLFGRRKATLGYYVPKENGSSRS